MTGRLIDISRSINGKWRITLELDADFQEQYQAMKEKLLDIVIKVHRKKRSRSANAYFHVLVNKIADRLHSSDDEVKRNLVLSYGTVATDDDGKTIGFKLPAKTKVEKLWPYTRCFDQRTENGTVFNCYIVYKETHLMNSAEMARLIDGAVYEARELGIETDPPGVLERYKQEWSKYEQN
jgi:hypothetical protein